MSELKEEAMLIYKSEKQFVPYKCDTAERCVRLAPCEEDNQRDMRALSCGQFALTYCSVAVRIRWALGVTCLNGRCVYHMCRD